jgi:hypothetical protein
MAYITFDLSTLQNIQKMKKKISTIFFVKSFEGTVPKPASTIQFG